MSRRSSIIAPLPTPPTRGELFVARCSRGRHLDIAVLSPLVKRDSGHFTVDLSDLRFGFGHPRREARDFMPGTAPSSLVEKELGAADPAMGGCNCVAQVKGYRNGDGRHPIYTETCRNGVKLAN
ncbi:hypothetical protein Bbelb_219900 [Branchiostoma belcheri]|nr:hypothetical protein Bbelb_219900 [Branchiostoma belcheri]